MVHTPLFVPFGFFLEQVLPHFDHVLENSAALQASIILAVAARVLVEPQHEFELLGCPVLVVFLPRLCGNVEFVVLVLIVLLACR